MLKDKYKIGEIVGWRNNDNYVGIITNLETAETRDDPLEEKLKITICWLSHEDRDIQKGLFKSSHDKFDFDLIVQRTGNNNK